MFSNENFLYSYYTNSSLKAIISLCASPQPKDGPLFFYSLALIDEQNNEIKTKDFQKLEEACDYANKKYSPFWSFEDKSQASAGGCDSCSAH